MKSVKLNVNAILINKCYNINQLMTNKLMYKKHLEQIDFFNTVLPSFSIHHFKYLHCNIK